MRRADLINQINKPHYILKYREITITNNESSQLSSFQVPIDIGGDFLEKANPNNLILVDSDNIIHPYWVEQWKRPGGTARIWTKVDLPASGGKTLKLYYDGIVGSNPQDGDNVFEFFDDFDGDSLDASKWDSTEDAGTITIENSMCKQQINTSSSTRILTVSGFTFGNERIYETALTIFSMANKSYTEALIRVGEYSGDSFDARAGYDGTDDADDRKVMATVRESNSYVKDTRTLVEDQKPVNRLKMTWTGSTVRQFYKFSYSEDWIEIGSAYSSFPTADLSPLRLSIYSTDPAPNEKVGWQWVFVRKYTATEPSVSVGSEITIYR